jgi:hypothetical protein
MISPWTVYWVMQADSLRGCVVAAGTLSATAACFAGLAFIMATATGDRDTIPVTARFLRGFSIATLVTFTFLPFAPTTKTLCAVLTIPAIANNETLQVDATEIYRLGMERLKEGLEFDNSPPPVVD